MNTILTAALYISFLVIVISIATIIVNVWWNK